MTGDWQPFILALAALVIALTPALLNLIVSLQSHGSIQRVEVQTNGHLTALQARVDALAVANATLQAQVAARHGADQAIAAGVTALPQTAAPEAAPC